MDASWARLCHSQGDALMQLSASVDRLEMPEVTFPPGDGLWGQ